EKDNQLPELPGGSGWLLIGDFDESQKKYIRGPFYKIVKSNYIDKTPFPRKGEIIRITTDRNVIIAGYKKEGTTRIFQPPWQENILQEEDYTGLKVKSGSLVEVRDISMGHFHGMPFVVWVRIAEPTNY
ncbi:MAG TPA: hypothetical protein VHO70_19210, partial [Chitinispirillaceae bacterium]|nr:hypothetical protein [Chitinispirillaceae bacterium]